jgi:hypothetical protein
MSESGIKVVAFNGSARKGGNTSILLKHVLNELENEGIETELVEMSGAEIHGCLEPVINFRVVGAGRQFFLSSRSEERRIPGVC